MKPLIAQRSTVRIGHDYIKRLSHSDWKMEEIRRNMVKTFISEENVLKIAFESLG